MLGDILSNALLNNMIKSEIELIKRIEEIRSNISNDSLLLFRGQTNLYNKIRSGKARPDMKIVPEVELGWNTIVNKINEKYSNTELNFAILQHYGFPTYYIDLTSNPLVASFFATNKYKELKPPIWTGNSFRFQDATTYIPINEGVGYVFVLEIPNYKELIQKQELFIIQNNNIFLRPKKQSAYLMLDHPPKLPNPNDFLIETLKVDRSKFKSSLSTEELFPNPKLDKGYQELLNVPYVQIPSYFLEKHKEEHEIEDIDKHFLFGSRAIKIPLYMKESKDFDSFNPKWKDSTLYEPSSFRLWKTENFNISEIFENQNKNFCESSKITISPTAFYDLLDNEDELELNWPNINSNNIFFTKSEFDYDKVINHNPPYFGIWLIKDDDLIFMFYLISDDNDDIILESGHSFIIENNKVKPISVKTKVELKKNNTLEDDYKILVSLLKIHSLIKQQKIALIQHPFRIENWYILL